MVWEECCQHGFAHLAGILCERHVLFFVNCFKLGMETAYNAVLETVSLYLCPILYLIGRNVFGVASYIEAGICIGSVGSDGCHQFVIFIGNGIFWSFVWQTVDNMIDGFALSFIRCFAIHFKLLFNPVEQRTFCFIVLCTEVCGSFKHQVFKVVCQTGGFRRVILSAHAYGNVGLDTRSLFVYGHIDLQSIVQCVDTCF